MELRDIEKHSIFPYKHRREFMEIPLIHFKIQLNMHTLLYKHKLEYLGIALVHTS
jgi:hypothetical protein